MAFSHEDGLVPAYKFAQRFAGKYGKLATMPDIIAARLASKNNRAAPWNTDYTTLSAEYLGLSREGRRILIVAHGIGPMSGLDGILKAYSWQYKDKKHNHYGGRITQEEFWDLEAGVYGKVDIIDFEAYKEKHEYPFLEVRTLSQALEDPLVLARLGPQAKEYLEMHSLMSQKWHRDMAMHEPKNDCNLSEASYREYLDFRLAQHTRDGKDGSDPRIIKIRDVPNCNYSYGNLGFRPIEEGYAFAHLLSINWLYSTYCGKDECLATDINCHSWSDGVRFVAIKQDGDITAGIHPGPNAYKLLHEHWKDLFIPVEKDQSDAIGFSALVDIKGCWFTQYPKKGASWDTGEPEYAVTAMAKMGSPIPFKTKTRDYFMLFMYGINEVQAIAPPGANAYCLVSEPENLWLGGDPKYQKAIVQFYFIKADTTQRLMRTSHLSHDYEAMMRLVEMETDNN